MKNITKLGILFFLMIIIVSCTKENIKKAENIDAISGRRIRYSISVSPSEMSSKSTFSDTVFVSLAMNDSIFTKFVDENGMVIFNNIAAGTVGVSISCKNYATFKYLADLRAEIDTTNQYDATNLRNEASIVKLIPISGTGTANLSGKVFADLDLTKPGYENAPGNIHLSAVICSNQLQTFILHEGSGKILNISCENSIFPSIVSTSGEYNLQIPAVSNGLKICIIADDFVYNQQINSTETLRKRFYFNKDTIEVFSGLSKIYDVVYN